MNHKELLPRHGGAGISEHHVSGNFTPSQISHLEKLVRELLAIRGKKTVEQLSADTSAEGLRLLRRYQAKQQETLEFSRASKQRRQEMIGVPEGYIGYEDIKKWLQTERCADGLFLKAN